MVGTYKASTCAGECLITGCSLRPNHPQISGAWIAPAWWPIVVSANQGNTSSRIHYWFNFALEAMQMCIQIIWCMSMVIKCGYMTGCIGQCRWTSGWGVNSSGVHSMDLLSIIQNIYITSLKTSPENTYNFTSASNFDDT